MSLILVIPNPLVPAPQALDETRAMLVRLRARLHTLAGLEGCDTAALLRQIAEVEGAIEHTERACTEARPSDDGARRTPAPLPPGLDGHAPGPSGSWPCAVPA